MTKMLCPWICWNVYTSGTKLRLIFYELHQALFLLMISWFWGWFYKIQQEFRNLYMLNSFSNYVDLSVFVFFKSNSNLTATYLRVFT